MKRNKKKKGISSGTQRSSALPRSPRGEEGRPGAGAGWLRAAERCGRHRVAAFGSAPRGPGGLGGGPSPLRCLSGSSRGEREACRCPLRARWASRGEVGRPLPLGPQKSPVLETKRSSEREDNGMARRSVPVPFLGQHARGEMALFRQSR